MNRQWRFVIYIVSLKKFSKFLSKFEIIIFYTSKHYKKYYIYCTIYRSHSIFVDPKSFCLYQYDIEDGDNIDGQFRSQYVKRDVRKNRGYPNFMLSNPLKTIEPYYFPENSYELMDNDNNYNRWIDNPINKGINAEMKNNEELDHFSKKFQKMLRLSGNHERNENIESNREQELANKVMDDSNKDNGDMASKLYQDDYLLSGSK